MKLSVEILANSADPDKTPQHAASDQGLHCLLELQKLKVKRNSFKSPVQDHFPSLHSETIDNRPTSAVSALMFLWSADDFGNDWYSVGR